MNDVEYEAQKARLTVVRDRWLRTVGLGQWRFTMSYDRTGADFADSVVRSGGFVSGSVARCYPDWRYLIATIIWNMPELLHVDDEDLERVFVHELMHVFLHEIRDVANGEDGSADAHLLEHEERVCSVLAAAFLWVRDSAQDGDMRAPEGEPVPPDDPPVATGAVSPGPRLEAVA